MTFQTVQATCPSCGAEITIEANQESAILANGVFEIVYKGATYCTCGEPVHYLKQEIVSKVEKDAFYE